MLVISTNIIDIVLYSIGTYSSRCGLPLPSFFSSSLSCFSSSSFSSLSPSTSSVCFLVSRAVLDASFSASNIPLHAKKSPAVVICSFNFCNDRANGFTRAAFPFSQQSEYSEMGEFGTLCNLHNHLPCGCRYLLCPLLFFLFFYLQLFQLTSQFLEK